MLLIIVLDMKLGEFGIGERARVVRVGRGSAYAERLEALGLTPGTVLTVLRAAPLGDPVAVRFRGFTLALRPSEAGEIELEPA